MLNWLIKVYLSFLILLSGFDFLLAHEKLFYIYEWPQYIDDVWPPQGATLHNKSAYSPDFRAFNGAGVLLDEKVGLFQTWQFSLYKNIISRMRTSRYRTRDPAKASAFIIPFDLGVHSYIDHLNGFPRLASPHGWMAQSLLKAASKNKEIFWKHYGHDHFVFLSITAYQMVGIGVKTFFMQICQNCTTVTIETSPTKTAIKGRTRKHWYAVPYPSSFHWYDGIKVLPWERLENSKRDILSLFIGSLKTSQPNSNNLRRFLYKQCKDDADCRWYKTAHSCRGVLNATNTMMLFRRSIFCPAPTGDSITRKSVFDALVAGCIPVLFSKATINQYIWHFTEEEMKTIPIYIPMKQINEGHVNFMQVLRNISHHDIREKQKLIERLAPRLQYSIVPDSSSCVSNDTCTQIWDPPFVDAQEVIIRNVLNQKTIEPINGFTDEELLEQHDRQNYIMSTHEDYAALRRDAPGRKPKWSPKKKITSGLAGVSKIINTV